MSQRIYTVNNKTDGTSRLVMATNPSQALRHVAHAQYDVKAASATDVAALMGAGTKVETVSTTTTEQE